MVSVGLTPGQVGKTAPLKTYSPGVSWTRRSGFTTEEEGSSPIRHPPRSWLLHTPRKRGPRQVFVAPIVRRISSPFASAHSARRRSFSRRSQELGRAHV